MFKTSKGRAAVRKRRQEEEVGSAGSDPLQLGSGLLLAVSQGLVCQESTGERFLEDLGSTFFS